MSTYYYLICDKHKEMCDGASRTAGGGACHLCDSQITLPKFIVAHQDCPLRVASEHEDTYETHTEWNEKNCLEMYNLQRDENKPL